MQAKHLVVEYDHMFLQSCLLAGLLPSCLRILEGRQRCPVTTDGKTNFLLSIATS